MSTPSHAVVAVWRTTSVRRIVEPLIAWEAVMKELHCRDAGFDCDAVVRGESLEDVLAQTGPHAKEVHGVEVTPEMAEAIATTVREI